MAGVNVPFGAMELPADLFIKPVPGDDDLVRFQYDFAVKALADAPTVTVQDDGDLIIEGYAAVFDGVDREGENFLPGAFERGVKAFLDGQAGLCYHHKHDKLLGKVLDLQVEEAKGLKMRARVDGAIRKHPELGVYYEQIKNGSLNALSVGGFFRRKLTEAGKRIADMDFTEISVTPVPVHSGTKFEVIAGKALASDLKVPDNVTAPPLPVDDIREEDFFAVQYALDSISRVISRMEKRGDGSTPNTDLALL